MAELSGPGWVTRFPTSKDPDDCSEPFRSNLKAFLQALAEAHATVSIAATLRPPQRAYLMHWCWMIAREDEAPEAVPARPGVDIDWIHRDPADRPDRDASVAAAAAMVHAYQIEVQPSLTSRHILGEAVDMDISWTGVLEIRARGARDVTRIAAGARNGSNPRLHDVGRSYGVLKLLSDPPHWSSNGH